MSSRSLFITAIVAVFIIAGATTIGHDKVQPFTQPEAVTISEKAAIKFKPSLIIGDTCHPYPAVNAAGETSGGLKGTGDRAGDCGGSSLGSQVYGRAVWHKGLWAIMFSWYFPKDVQYGVLYDTGHRHKWSNVIVWLDNPALNMPNILAVSISMKQGKYETLKSGQSLCGRRFCSPFRDYFNGATPMLQHSPTKIHDNGLGLDMTTERGGELQDLVLWEQLTEEARNALDTTDFGEKSKVPFIDANFEGNLDAARPFI